MLAASVLVASHPPLQKKKHPEGCFFFCMYLLASQPCGNQSGR
ncbi:hypothetical protein SD77_2522 [Bacillus badius]|uniref:Ribose 5-phosphate isomerase B n=1 Tax=Bacillus badius TaxID=1455 RepID=A0ABR5AZB1_BACBA|nr:hypothetical protein SD78_2018 [Bacillus badius]KIL80068.1 hypothetical protein SD77_2522 [Bacillus badius]